MDKQNIKEFMNSTYCSNLRKDIGHARRRIHHALDNYGINMPDSLENALKSAETSLDIVISELLTKYK